jgi:ArsR family transcriptional regulator, zinc-responsive transcriptional repressor
LPDSDLEDELKEFRIEIRKLKEDIRSEVKKAVNTANDRGSIRVDIDRDELSQTEPSTVVVKDLVKMIRDGVRTSLAEKGERAVDQLVEDMLADSAAELLKSLANPERLKIVKLLYSSNKTFSDLKIATSLEAPSVNHHLKSLLRMGLVAHGDEGGYVLTRRGRILVRTLALMNEALGGEAVD